MLSANIHYTDIIDAFEDYESLEAMPNAQLCSYCYGAKLRMMQQSPYSAYDELFAQTLETVNKREIIYYHQVQITNADIS